MQLNESDVIKCQMLLINKCQTSFWVISLLRETIAGQNSMD